MTNYKVNYKPVLVTSPKLGITCPYCEKSQYYNLLTNGASCEKCGAFFACEINPHDVKVYASMWDYHCYPLGPNAYPTLPTPSTPAT